MSAIPAQAREYHLPPELNGYQNITLRQGPVPNPKPTEVLVKIRAVSLNNRDLATANGAYPRNLISIKNEVIPCSDMAGEVVRVGQDVRRFKNGDRVSANFALDHIAGGPTPETKATVLAGEIDGVLTEYRTFPEHSLVRIPDYISYEEASTFPCAGVTAYNALIGDRPLKGGDTVLVLGTSGVSVFAVQFAVASGAVVIVTSSSDDKLKLAKDLGAKHVVNYKTTPDWDKEVLKITNGIGVDHVVEMGGPVNWMKALESLRYDGVLHVVGSLGGLANTSSILMPLIQKALHMHGVQVGSRTQFEEMLRLAQVSGIRPLIDRVFEFEEAKEAFAYLSKKHHFGKIVIRVA